MAISGSSRDGKAIPAQEAQAKRERIEKDLTKSKVIDTRVVVDVDTAIIKTKRYIDGSNWTVDYYNQLSTMSDTIGGVDSQISDIEQQYIKVKGLVLKVTSAIPADQLTEMSGDATVTDFIPSVGDVFTARVVGNILALFTVTEVNERTYNLDRVYDITYKLDSTEVSNPSAFETIYRRVTKEYIYDVDSLLTESDALLLTSDYEDKEWLESKIKSIQNRYIKMHHNGPRNLLIGTADNTKVYDSCVADLFNTMSDRTSSTNVIKSSLGSTVVDVLITGTKEYLQQSDQPSYIAPPKGDKYQHRYRNLIGLDVTYILGSGGINILPEHSDLPNIGDTDNTYLFSRNFYNQSGELSLIESLLSDILNNKILDMDSVTKLVKNSFMYTHMDSYRYTPFILFIMRYTVSTTHSK